MKIQIPVNSLQLRGGNMPVGIEGEEGQIKPEVNDPVNFSVEGVVTAISGNTATVDVRFINGERPEAGESEEQEGTEKEPTGDELAKMAEEADAEGEE